MFLSYRKLEEAGYEIRPSKEGVEIVAASPFHFDFRPMEEQWHQANLSPLAREVALEAWYGAAEMAQILEACK